MTSARDTLTHPLPYFHHVATGRVLYIAIGDGRCPLVFSIDLKGVVRHAPVIDREPVIQSTTHPFGRLTTVGSLAEDEVRRELADAKPFEPGALEEVLALWANFCDDVADQLNDGEPLEDALDDTWTVCPVHDVALEDDEPVVGAQHQGAR